MRPTALYRPAGAGSQYRRRLAAIADITAVPGLGQRDGNTVYRLNVKDVPAGGFWLVSVKDAGSV